MRQPHASLSNGVHLSRIQRSIDRRYKEHLLQDVLWTPPCGSSGSASPWDQELSGDSATGEATLVKGAGDLTLHFLACLKEIP